MPEGGADRSPDGAAAAATDAGLRPAQRRAVEAGGSVAVVAGAGTGKTHMLAHRFLKHVRDGLDPLEIVAVTFTERAAAELRSRIRSLLNLSLPRGSQALLTVEAAQISTLHSLAQRVCREFPEQAGVAADFTILDDLEGGVWLAERIDSAMSAVQPDLFKTVGYGTVREALLRLLEDPITADAAFEHGPETWEALVAEARSAALAELTGAGAWREAVEVVRSVAGAEGDRREATRRQAVSGLDQLERGETAAGLESLADLSFVGGSKKAFADGDFAVITDALKYVRESVRLAQRVGLVDLELGEVDERMAEVLPLLEGAYRLARQQLEADKLAKRVLDFADLEVHALRALADPEVVAHYRSRWRALLVDEFQDTNAVQEKILDALTGSLSVTVVGDEKQSIYGFRGAKAEVFRRFRRHVLAEGGDEVVLGESFRSHARLLDDLNATFAPLLTDQHQELGAVRTAAPGDGPFTTLTVVAGGGNKAARQLSEARALATTIKTLVAAGTPVHDKGTGELRPMRFDDVAVLARGWQALGVYGEVLPALGVPAVHTGGGNLLAMREAKDGITLIRALTDPHDDVAMVALLRSPFFAVDDRTLYGLATRTGSFWQALESATELGAAAERARDVITDLLARRGTLTPSALLQVADSLTGHSAVLAGLPGGRRRLADYGGFVDLVRRLETGSEDLFTVWRRLRLLVAAGVEVRRPDLAASGAVTLLTIHSSKGLEWPVVVVADLERRGRAQHPALLVDADVGVSLRLDDAAGEALLPAVFRVLRARQETRERQETHRLLYVALTRARDRLILSAAGEKGGALDLLVPGLEAAGVTRVVEDHDPLLAVYPAQPPPLAARPVGRTAAADRDLARLVEPPRQGADGSVGQLEGAAPNGVVDDEWSTITDLVATLADDWLPLTAALAAAGVRPPASELAGRWLKGGGDGTESSPPPTYVLLAWRVTEGVLVLSGETSLAGHAVTDGSADSASGGSAAVAGATIARRPRDESLDDEPVRAVVMFVDPLADPGITATRIAEALSATNGKRGT